MRQVGVLAAAGLLALETMVDRLAEDHDHAKRLARGRAELPRLRLDPGKVQTNIVIFHVDRDGGSAELAAGCLARKVKIHQIGPGAIRCVTHKDVDREDIDRALGLSLPEHGYHAPNENFDWQQASGGMVAFAKYFEEISNLNHRLHK